VQAVAGPQQRDIASLFSLHWRSLLVLVDAEAAAPGCYLLDDKDSQPFTSKIDNRRTDSLKEQTMW
jgi:hypothetical protein